MTTLIIELQQLLKTAIISPSTVAIDIDAELAKEKEIAIIWSIRDIQAVRPDLTDDQAWKVLLTVKNRHHANMAISWDTLRCFADDLFPEIFSDSEGE